MSTALRVKWLGCNYEFRVDVAASNEHNDNKYVFVYTQYGNDAASAYIPTDMARDMAAALLHYANKVNNGENIDWEENVEVMYETKSE